MTDNNFCPRCGFKLDLELNVKKRKPISPSNRLEIFKRDGYRCVICKSDINLQIDHKKPLSKGGTDDERNLQTLCWKCNVGKSDRLEKKEKSISFLD